MWAYAGVTLGAAISIAANVQESRLSPDVSVGSIVAATFWPVALFVSLEIFARTRARVGWWTWIRWTGLVPVAVIAGVASYIHMHLLLLSYGEPLIIAIIGPLAVDGMMVLATGGLVATSPGRREGVELESLPVEEIDVETVDTDTHIENTSVSVSTVSQLTSKDERIAARLEIMKKMHTDAGRDWRTDRIGYKEIEQYLGLTGGTTRRELYQALYPPANVESQAE